MRICLECGVNPTSHPSGECLGCRRMPLEHDSRCDRDLCHPDCPIRKRRRKDDH